MKKIISLWVVFVMLLFSVTGCSGKISQAKNILDDSSKKEKLTIVTTIFPPYDFSRQILGDYGEVIQLLPLGAESHSFEPSPKDILTIQNADLFIYVGGENDAWVKEIVDSLGENAPQIITLMEMVQSLPEEVVEGMEPEDADHNHDEEHSDEEHSDEEHHEGEHDDGIELDEHVWTSPRNAMIITAKILQKIKELDPDHGNIYEDNAKNYLQQLEQLHEDYTSTLGNSKGKTIVVGDRFPFRYLANDYGLKYYAAFVGCSTQTEAGAGTVAFLVEKVKEMNIPTVFYMEFSNHKIADAIADGTGSKTAQLHSAHNISKNEWEQGETYVSLMRKNLQLLEEALNQ